MPNGAAALAVLPLNLPSPTKSDPRAELEQRIGEVTADAVVVLGRAIGDFETGSELGLTTRALGGERLAAVCRLQLEHFGDDFHAIARAQAKRTLRMRHGAALQAQLKLSESALDAAFDDLIGHVLTIADRVVADERARMN
jgi:hypothetical protein